MQAYFTGWWGYERQDAWNLYARASSFVDCRNFTPPRGTAFLCPTEPVTHRLPPAFYETVADAIAEVASSSPAREAAPAS